MIRIKVFISSVQKELQEERTALGGLLATDPFLSSSTVPRLFEEYPAPLRPNKQAYLELLRACHVYLLIIGGEYGQPLSDGLSASHQEYRLAQQQKLPTLVCVKGDARFVREEMENAFLEEVRRDGHTYSRFRSLDELLKKARGRLIEYIQRTFETEPTPQQVEQARETLRCASDFERQLVHNLSWADLDPGLTRELVAAAEEKRPEKLSEEMLIQAMASRGYLWFDAKANLYRPTSAAVLLLARSPSMSFPQARIQLDAYFGAERDAQPLDSVLVDQPLPTAVEQAVAFVRRNTARPLKVEGLRRVASEGFPQEALREAIVNAVAHRDYENAGVKITVEVFSDRVVFSSPGPPPGNQPIERIGRGEGRSKARNPLVVQGLTWLELMDERGSGIRRMREVMHRQGLGMPRFALVENELTVTLMQQKTEAVLREEATNKQTGEDLLGNEPFTDRQKQILRLVLEKGFVTSAACVQALGIVKDTAWRDLNDLIIQGYLQKAGTGRASRYLAGVNLERIISSDSRTQIGRKSDANSEMEKEVSNGQAQIRRKGKASGSNRTQSGGRPSKK
jgi:ATP-dependent DNA helicase RecG